MRLVSKRFNLEVWKMENRKTIIEEDLKDNLGTNEPLDLADSHYEESRYEKGIWRNR
jgi:hypothetical protein